MNLVFHSHLSYLIAIFVQIQAFYWLLLFMKINDKKLIKINI